ncbi:glycosyltransferase family 2 protein, partial [Lactococcus cremoris]
MDCISSIQAQIYKNFEIVIVDNASNNGLFEYLVLLQSLKIKR